MKRNERGDAKLGVTNDRDTQLVVCVEPYADEFILLPGESLEIVARFKGHIPYLHAREAENGVWVYIERGGELIDVVKDGQSLWHTA